MMNLEREINLLGLFRVVDLNDAVPELSDHPAKLDRILKAVQENISNVAQLHRLSKKVSALATREISVDDLFAPDFDLEPAPKTKKTELLDFAFELGKHLLQITVNEAFDGIRREIIHSLVEYLTKIGLEDLENLVPILGKWQEFFTAREAANDIAPIVMSESTIAGQDEGLSSSLRKMALQCVLADPANCAQAAVQICKSSRATTEELYNALGTAADSGLIGNESLFGLARYVNQKGDAHRARQLGLLAVRRVKISADQDSHPDFDDLKWAINLSNSTCLTDYAQWIPLVVENIHSAEVLNSIIEVCKTRTVRTSYQSTWTHRGGMDSPPFKALLNATISAYANRLRCRATGISPIDYADFVDDALEPYKIFLRASDGEERFTALLEEPEINSKHGGMLSTWIKARCGQVSEAEKQYSRLYR